MTYRVGQLVVCVWDESISDWFGRDLPIAPHCPVKGLVYTIRSIEYWNELVGLRLEELHNPPAPGMKYETVFDSSMFRPIVKPEISVFHGLLQPVKDRVPV